MSRPTRFFLPPNRRSPNSRTTRLAVAVLLALALALPVGCGGDVDSRMQEVRALQDVGQFTQSIEELREILAISPDLPEANYRLGAALVQTGDPSRAIWALQRAAESEEFAVPAGLVLASTHFMVRDLEEAVRAANRVLEIDPDRLAALNIRAKANLGIHRFDEALADVERLLEAQPDDYTNHVIHATVLWEMGRGAEAEAAHVKLREMGEASDDPSLRPRACLAPAMFAKDYKKDLVAAEALYRECLDTYPDNAYLINEVMDFLDGIDKPEAATEVIRAAVEREPDNLSLRSTLANRMLSEGDEAGAEEMLRTGAENLNSAAAWSRLATYYRSVGKPAEALAAIEKVVTLTGGGSSDLRFTQADVLVDLGEYDRAEEVIQTVDEPIYATLIRGRIQLAQGNAEQALASFEKGIRHWPNNAGARYLAGAAAYEIGDWRRATSELREALRADPSSGQATKLLARIYFERGDYQQAISFANRSAVGGGAAQLQPEDYVMGIRALTELREFDDARERVADLRKLPDQEAAAAVELAHVETAANGAEAGIAAIEASGLDVADPANDRLLRAKVEYLLVLGRTDAALAAVDGALAKNAGSASAHAIRGNVLLRKRSSDDARIAFERGLTLSPEHSESLTGLAVLAGNNGNFAEAVGLFDRAAASATQSSAALEYSAAQLTLQQGDRDGATKRMREVVRKYPGHSGSRNDLAWLVAESGGDLDEALAMARDAQRLDASPEILDTLGFVHLKRNEGTAAVAVLEKAYAQRPDSPAIAMHLGMALAMEGNSGRARELLQTAIATEGFAEAETAQRELAKLQ
jgi:tetratricopeptide (TPR) repeat protein